MKVEWRDLRVDFDGGTVQAVRGVSGTVPSGRLMAIMGSTGCGKSTLLNALSGRGLITSGVVRYGDESWSWSKALKRHIGFVEQDDVVYGNLTVRQSLLLLAQLRLPALSRGAVNEKVGGILTLLRLGKCADSLVGDDWEGGISGGERKRLCIAQEMLTEPRVIFCDEPTSGLDSSTARLVVQAMLDLAVEKGVTVISSIHQPSTQVFNLFNDLLLLDNGVALYRGPADQLGQAFERIGFPCEKGWTVCDWVMDTVVLGKVPEKVRAHLELNCRQMFLPPVPAAPGKLTETTMQRYGHCFLQQVRILGEREWLLIKSGMVDSQTCVMHLGNSVIAGAMFFRTGFNEEDVWCRFTACFMLVVVRVFFPLMSSVHVLPEHKLQLRKELAAGSYRLSAWFLAKTSIAMAKEYVWPFFSITVFYWLTGINDRFSVFVQLYALLLLVQAQFHSLGLLLGGVFDPKTAGTASMLFITFFFFYTGLFVPFEQIPAGLQWVVHANPMVYSMFLTIQIAFDADQTYACNPPSSPARQGFPQVCDKRDSILRDDIFEKYHVDRYVWWVCLVQIVVTTLGLRLAAFILFRQVMQKEVYNYEHMASQVLPVGTAGDGEACRPRSSETSMQSRLSSKVSVEGRKPSQSKELASEFMANVLHATEAQRLARRSVYSTRSASMHTTQPLLRSELLTQTKSAPQEGHQYNESLLVKPPAAPGIDLPEDRLQRMHDDGMCTACNEHQGTCFYRYFEDLETQKVQMLLAQAPADTTLNMERQRQRRDTAVEDDSPVLIENIFSTC